MTEQDELRGMIKSFAALGDSESGPMLMTLATWRAELDARQAELAALAISLAARFETLIAAQDAFFADKVAFDHDDLQLSIERGDYSAAFAAMQSQLLGAAMRYRDRAAYAETSLVIEEAE